MGYIDNPGDAVTSNAPPELQGRIVAMTVKIDVRQVFDLDNGYAREGWGDFLWLSGWRAQIAVFVLKLLR